MSAGMPGLGLGGLFFILSALAAPCVELGRTLRGRSGPGAWREVGRNLLLSLLMIAAVDVSLRAFLALALLWGVGSGDRLLAVTVIPLGPAAITAAVLTAVLASAKLVELGLRLTAKDGRPSGRRVARPRRPAADRLISPLSPPRLAAEPQARSRPSGGPAGRSQAAGFRRPTHHRRRGLPGLAGAPRSRQPRLAGGRSAPRR